MTHWRQKPVDVEGRFRAAYGLSRYQEAPVRPSGGPRWALILFWVSFVTLLALLSNTAFGHGDAQWIAAGGYKDAFGSSCCGNMDCHSLPEHAVNPTFREETNSYIVVWSGRLQEVPSGSVHISQRPGWWVCEWLSDFVYRLENIKAGDIRCLFRPEWRM